MKPIKVVGAPSDPAKWAKPQPRRPVLAGSGRLRKIAMLGGARTLRFAPWHDPTWELWAHASCREKCVRQPDVLFDIHPPELWKDPMKKFWDPSYYDWLKVQHIPIYMQDKYPEVPASMRYPFETMITEFPRGYMANTCAYMIALALMEGVTHLSVYGCEYASASEYGPQRGSMEYWLGVAEGRGVHVQIPPGCDLLARPRLLYGYESHPNGIRDKSYMFVLGPRNITSLWPERSRAEAVAQAKEESGINGPLFNAESPSAPPLMDIGQAPAPGHWERFE